MKLRKSDCYTCGLPNADHEGPAGEGRCRVARRVAYNRRNAPLRDLADIVTVLEPDAQRYIDAGYRVLLDGRTLVLVRKLGPDDWSTGWKTKLVGTVTLGRPKSVAALT